MKNIVSIYILFLVLVASNVYSQSVKWHGYGSGLSHLKIYDNKVKVQTIRDAFEDTYDFISLKSSELLLYKEKSNLDEDNGSPRIVFKDINKDSVILYYKTQNYLFINHDKIKYKNRFTFNSISFEHLSEYRQVKSKIEFNRYGHFRKSDGKNSTILEVEVSSDELNQFKEIISKIDIKNIYATNRWMNICDDDEYSFTFIDLNGMRYNYTATEIRETLKPVYNYMDALAKLYKN